MKRCPICKIEKALTEYSHYWSKSRQKLRPQNYCKVCSPSEKTKRSAEYFQRHREEKLQYAKDYRANPANKEKRKRLEVHFKKKYRKELQDCYIADELSRKKGLSVKQVRETDGLIEAYRAKIKLIRKIKELKNEKQAA